MLELVDDGGPFVYVLGVLAFVSMFLILERIFFFQKVRINVGDLLLGLANHVRKGAFAEALHEAARAPGPAARVAHAVLMRKNLPRRDLRDVAQEAGQLEVPRMERNLRGLYGIALVAPLVGMLGTISSLVMFFMEMSEDKGFSSASAMSRGVYQALVTSGLGLAISVAVFLFYLFFYGRVKRMVHRIERTGIEMVNIICDAREQGDIVSFRDEADDVVAKKQSKK
ncbi:MotA/TolQ/ExbB proton channel family protein [Verrucomicrobiaceae bacterium N1E253]|uniref:MotA/TolQ/ExbB proton channel family protein n=1 Tax=Oceaniferula marina TaxID=2748318 RepID=A0A851GH88_9BACT|nr:MotA/TolQ/ExbB proton channel family protein [Oceaniferula marina]NWK56893.1 MotA/TolQ/ExbB proton channel family protein [Oceaniferula marina]